MEPTMHLRWATRGLTVRVLQQWWSRNGGSPKSGDIGEWRDVPMEVEE